MVVVAPAAVRGWYVHGSSWSNWAELLGLHVHRPGMRRGRSVMTAGLKAGDGWLHFAGIKFRNKPCAPPTPHSQIDHEMVGVTNGAHHSWFSCECVKHVSWLTLPSKLSLSCVVFRSHATGRRREPNIWAET